MQDPRWLAIARAYLGVREIVGAKNSPIILGWIRKLGAAVLGIAPNDDETPWCGTFVSEVMTEAGFVPPPIAIRAASWARFGKPCTPCLGAVLVFQRPGGGHVGFYVAERADAYQVLGGNQGNAVSLAWVSKDRMVASRWPQSEAITTAPVRIAAAAAPLSRDEA